MTFDSYFYQKNGFGLFKCKHKRLGQDSKKPGVEHWKDPKCQLRPEEAEAYIEQDILIGAAVPCNIVILDCDVKEDEKNFLKNIHIFKRKTGFCGDLNETFTVKTMNGGSQHYFYYDGGKISNGANVGDIPGLDIRALNGYVITCNSPGYSATNENDIMPLPPELCRFLGNLSARKNHKKIDPNTTKSFLSIDQLKEILSVIPADRFAENDKWRNFCFSVFEAAGFNDAVMDAIIEWSGNDNRYRGMEDKNRARLSTFKSGGGIGVGTFIMYLNANVIDDGIKKMVRDAFSEKNNVEVEHPENDFKYPFIEPNFEEISKHEESVVFFTTQTNTAAARVVAMALRNNALVDMNSDLYTFDGSRFNLFTDRHNLVFDILKRIIVLVYKETLDIENFNKCLIKIGSTKFKNDVFSEVRDSSEIRYSEQIKWDSSALVETLTLSDGVLDFTKPYFVEKRQGRFDEFRKDFIDVTCDAVLNSTMPEKFNDFLDSIFPDYDTLKTVRDCLSLIVSGESRLRKFIMFYGSGKNGKTTLINMINDVIGSRAFNFNASLLLRNERDSHGGPDPEKVMFRGKLACFASEAPANKFISTVVVKQLAGGDSVTAAAKYKAPETFWPTWQLILATNDLPRFDGNDEAFFDRIIVIPFTVRFYGSEEQKERYKKNGFDEKCLKPAASPDMLNHSVEQERAAILMQMINDYQRLKHDRKSELFVSEECHKYAQTYKENNDEIGNFISEFCIVGIREDAFITSSEIANRYRIFVSDDKISGKSIITNIKKHNTLIENQVRWMEYNTPTGIEKKKVRGLRNIRWKDDIKQSDFSDAII